MKRVFLVFATIACVLALTFAADKPAAKSGSHVGTWQLVSSKYGDAKDFSDFPKTERRIKLINPTHFTWVQYAATTQKVESLAGGTYTLEGDAYTETIEFIGDGMEPYLGKKQAFTIKVDGDKLLQTGQLSMG